NIAGEPQVALEIFLRLGAVRVVHTERDIAQEKLVVLELAGRSEADRLDLVTDVRLIDETGTTHATAPATRIGEEHRAVVAVVERRREVGDAVGCGGERNRVYLRQERRVLSRARAVAGRGLESYVMPVYARPAQIGVHAPVVGELEVGIQADGVDRGVAVLVVVLDDHERHV